MPQDRDALQGVDTVLEGEREPVRNHHHVATADAAEKKRP
jgi:hypothetical protein